MSQTRQPSNLGKAFAHVPDQAQAALIDLSAAGAPRMVSYGEFDALCDAVARGISRAGVPSGAQVGLMAANSARALAVLLGTLRAGRVAVPLNPRAGAEALTQMAADAELTLCFCDSSGARALPEGLRCVRLEGEDFDHFIDPGPFEAHQPADDDTALILFTSGSTGRPKGVLLSHASQLLIAKGYATAAMADCLKAGPTVVAAPLFHMNATVFCTLTLMMGGAMVLLPRFETQAFMDALTRYGVSVVSGVPTMAALIAQQAQADTRYPAVKLVTIGSAPLSEAVLAQVHRLFPEAGVINSYGTTETGAGYFGSHPEGRPRPPMSVGCVQPHARMRLVGGATPDEGVLEIHCATRMSGYLKRQDLTAAKLREGWIHTGDIMRRDADGWYYFVGRADDMFVCAGENVYPGEVERLLERHAEVLEVCVLPFADEVRGHVPVAFVVLRAGAVPSEQALKDHVLSRAAPHLHPRRIWFIDQMPLAGTNKIDRRELQERALKLAAM